MEKSKTMRLNKWFPAFIFGIFVLGSLAVVSVVHYQMDKQALVEAERKSMIRLDQNMAIHSYFSKQLKPKLFEWTAPFRSQEYFEPAWMSSTYAVREIEKYFKSLSDEPLYYKECAINARSPENEATLYEKLFLERLNKDSKLEYEHAIHTIDGKPFYVTLRRGEVMEVSCLRCHSEPEEAPKEMVDIYGPERSFHRSEDEVVQAISIRIPLAETYKGTHSFANNLSFILLGILACLSIVIFFFSRQFIFKPIDRVREMSQKILSGGKPLGEMIPLPYWRELRQLTDTFNYMAKTVHHNVTDLERIVKERTHELEDANSLLRKEIEERKQAEEVLEFETKRFSLLLEMFPGFIYLQAPDYSIRYANKYFSEKFGEPKGRLCHDVLWGRKEPCEVCPTFEVFDKKRVQIWEWSQTPDGKIYDVYDYPFLDSDGSELVLEIGVDITARRQAEEQVKASLLEKDALLREIHHRVKNNMQVIISLIKIQASNIKDEPHTQMIQESQRRIKSMALVHEKLYQTDNFAELDVRAYVESLVTDVLRSYGSSSRITPIFEIEDIVLGLAQGIPFGLIINELVSNAVKYAFPENRDGEIRIAVRAINEDDLVLDVHDNGVGIPEGLDMRGPETMGLRLVSMLSEDQLEGKVALNRVNGTRFQIQFKNHLQRRMG